MFVLNLSLYLSFCLPLYLSFCLSLYLLPLHLESQLELAVEDGVGDVWLGHLEHLHMDNLTMNLNMNNLTMILNKILLLKNHPRFFTLSYSLPLLLLMNTE